MIDIDNYFFSALPVFEPKRNVSVIVYYRYDWFFKLLELQKNKLFKRIIQTLKKQKKW